MIKTFYVGIKAVILKNGKVLVLKRENKKGEIIYDLPGGRINDEENIEAALRREVEEEISIKNIKVGSLIHADRLTNYHSLSGGSTKLGLVVLYYKVNANTSGIKLSDEHFEHKWINKNDLTKILKSNEGINKGIVNAISLVL